MRSVPKKSFASRAYYIIAAAVVMLAFFSLNIVKEVMARREVSREIERLQSEIKRLELENGDMNAFLQSWDESSRLEREARLKLGLQRSGEQAVMVVRPEETAPLTAVYAETVMDATNGPSASDQPRSNITKWWDYFFH